MKHELGAGAWQFEYSDYLFFVLSLKDQFTPAISS